MTIWVLLLVLAAGTIALKAIGPVAAGGREPPAPLTRVIALVAPALITALVVADTFTDDRTLVLDARAAGLAVGALALLLRAPAAVAMVLAVITCALLRLLH